MQRLVLSTNFISMHLEVINFLAEAAGELLFQVDCYCGGSDLSGASLPRFMFILTPKESFSTLTMREFHFCISSLTFIYKRLVLLHNFAHTLYCKLKEKEAETPFTLLLPAQLGVSFFASTR